MVGPPGRIAKLGRVLGGRFYRIERGSDAAQDRRFPRSPVQRLIGQSNELRGMEGRGEAFQPHRRHFPVAVTPRAAKQIELAARAFNKGRTQFAKQLRIVANCRSQVGIDRIAKVSHGGRLSGRG